MVIHVRNALRPIGTMIGGVVLMGLVAACSSGETESQGERQAAVAEPRSGAAICIDNQTSSSFAGTSENTREQDRDVLVEPGTTGCAWWVGSSNPKLIVMGALGPSFEVVRSGNFEITFCDTKLKLPFDSEGESPETTIECYGNNYIVKAKKAAPSYSGKTYYTAVVRDS
jgi:hypothetical protein